MALILPYTAMGLPLAVYLLKVFLDSLPDELFDAARSTGAATSACSLVGPAAAQARAGDSGNLLGAQRLERVPPRPALHQRRALKTLPTGLLAFSDRYTTDYQLLFSALSIITLPMVAVYVVFHRQIVAGVTEGAVR